MAHGLEFRDAAGNITLRMTDALPRLIHSQRFAWNFSGTISVPAFDTDFGMFYVSPCVATGLGGGASFDRDNRVPAPGVSGAFGTNGTSLPTLSWDNTTKVMTIAPTTFPGGWPFETQIDYVLNFIALNKRFVIA